MHKRKVIKALWGLQFNSTPLTSLNSAYSPIRDPNFNTFQLRLLPQSFKFPTDIYTGLDLNETDFNNLKFKSGLNLATSALSPIARQYGLQILQERGKLMSTLRETRVGGSSDATNNAIDMNKVGNIAAIGGAVADLTSSFLPEKTEYSGDKGEITLTMDSAYDSISDAAMSFGPIGMMVGGIMKGGKLLGGVVNSLGGGTDGMTSTDAILGSSFLNLTPIGLINGFGGLKAETITKNDLAFELVGSSYTGTGRLVDDALKKSGKKYGLFSSGARKEANNQILKARGLQNIMENIADFATDRFALRNYMAAFNGNRRKFALQGGYNQSAVRVGRNGLSFKNIVTAKRVVSTLKYGGKTKKSRTLKELITYAKNQNPRFIQRLSEPPRGIQFIDDEGNETRGNVYLEWSTDDKGNAVIYPRIQEMDNGKLLFLPAKDAFERAIEKNNILIMSPEEANIFFSEDSEYGTAYKRGWPEMFKPDWGNDDSIIENLVTSNRNGGILEISLSDIPEEYLEPLNTIEEVILESILPEFKEGGKVNVIPEGALHARLHHMENAENLTKKGIPVVSEKEGGEVEQQAEIEKNEVILRLEVTKKLEELLKNYYNDNYTQKQRDEFAIEAGRLLVYELLLNTVDNTGLLNEI